MKDEGRVIIMEMTFKEMLNAIDGEVIVQKEEINFNKLCIDTRKIEKNNVFLAIKGSIAVSHSTSYTTSVLTSFTTIQRFPETPISSL